MNLFFSSSFSKQNNFISHSSSSSWSFFACYLRIVVKVIPGTHAHPKRDKKNFHCEKKYRISRNKIQQKKKWAFHWENSVSHSLYLSSGFFLIGPFFDILFHFGYSMFWTFFFSLVSYTERYIYRKRNENHIDYECFYF